MANSGPKSCKTVQKSEGASNARSAAGQISLRPQVSGFGLDKSGTEVYLSGFGRRWRWRRLRLGEGVGEQAGGVALGGVLLEALYQLKTRLR